MSRRRFVYTEGGRPLAEPYEVGADWTDAPKDTLDGIKFNYDGLRQADGTVTDTPKKLREWCQRTGAAHLDDFKEHRQKVQAERERAFSDKPTGYDRERRVEAVKRAYETLRSQGPRQRKP